MIPHTLMLKPGLVIHRVYNGYWFWGRPSFYDLWHDLRAATSEIRLDRDLSTPGSGKPGTRATFRTFTAGTGGPRVDTVTLWPDHGQECRRAPQDRRPILRSQARR